MNSWTQKDIDALVRYAAGSMPAIDIARKLNRTQAAVKAKAKVLGVSLKPKPNSPWGRKP